MAPELIRQAATDKLAALKRDPVFADAYLKGGAEQRNTMHTLLELAHGQRSEAEQRELASSIKLEPLLTLRAAERQRDEAAAATDATKPNIPYSVASKYTPEQVGALQDDISTWASGLKLSPTSARTVLDRIASDGPKVAAMSPAELTTWLQDQDRMLIGAAGSREKAAAWRADATKVLQGGKYNLESSPVLHSAWIIRHLAIAASAQK